MWLPIPGRAGWAELAFSTAASPPEIREGRGWTPEAVAAWLTAEGLPAAPCAPRGAELVVHFAPEARFAAGSLERRSGDGLPAGVEALVGRVPGEARAGALEVRALEAGAAELRVAEGEGPEIVGYAAVWDRPTTLWPGFREVIRRGAFAADLAAGADVRAFWNHNRDHVLGRRKAGTLEIAEDAKGLAFTIRAPSTPLVRDMVLAPMARGDVDGASFGFFADEAPETFRAGFILREIKRARLEHVSPVAIPQYREASSALRSLGASGDPGELVGALEDRGLTRGQIAAMLDSALGLVGAAHPGGLGREERQRVRRLAIEALET